MSPIAQIFRARHWPLIAFLLSAGLLGGAYAFEYIGGLAPCQMCYWQRYAHMAVLAAALLAMIVQRLGLPAPIKRASLLLIAIAFGVSAYIAIWHMGVEYKWWAGLESCLGAPSADVFSIDDLLGSLEEPMKIVPCDEAAWTLFGISMAGYNAALSTLALLASLFVTFRKETL